MGYCHIRQDHSPPKNKLVEGAVVVGSPVTFDFDMESTYANLTGSSYQARFVSVSLNYLENVLKAVQKAYKDTRVKQEFDSAWTKHNVALVVVKTDKELEDLKADKTTVGSSYFRVRLFEGKLQVVSNTRYFDNNMNDVAVIDLTPLASVAAAQSAGSTPGASDDLPLEIRIKMRDVQPKVDEALNKIRKLKGLEDASFNVDEQTRVCYAKLKLITDRSTLFTPDTFSLYLDHLNTLLIKQWKDEMISEALLEEWRAPHVIEFQPETDLEAEQGSKVVKDGRYNA